MEIVKYLQMNKARLVSQGELGPLDKPPSIHNPVFNTKMQPQDETDMSAQKLRNEIQRERLSQQRSRLPSVAKALRRLPIVTGATKSLKNLPAIPTYGALKGVMSRGYGSAATTMRETSTPLQSSRILPQPNRGRKKLPSTPGIPSSLIVDSTGLEFSVMQTYN